MAKKISYIGIDLGGSSLKIVELQSVNNRPQLVTYGFADQIPNIVKDESQAALTEAQAHLKALVKETRVTSTSAISALPSFSVFSSIINLPEMNKKDLIDAVRWEAKKFVPIPLEEMILDWEVLKDSASADLESDKKDRQGDKAKKQPAKAKGNVKVLLTAAPKSLVNRYVELFKGVGMQLVGLETESFALERALIGNDRNPIMVIDIGGQTTSMIIYSEGVPILNKSIDVGGYLVTKSLYETMGLDLEQAEQFKRDMGTTVTPEDLDSMPSQVGYVVNSIINEIRFIHNNYRNQNKKPIAKIVLTGGSSYLMGLAPHIQKVFNIKSYIGDPWARVVHPVEIDSLLKRLGPRMAVSIGLAMRELV